MGVLKVTERDWWWLGKIFENHKDLDVNEMIKDVFKDMDGRWPNLNAYFMEHAHTVTEFLQLKFYSNL